MADPRETDRNDLARLAEEQAALRRVATLVARGSPRPELFSAVTTEAAQLLAVDYAALGRYEPEGVVVCLAAWGQTANPRFQTGARSDLVGDNVTTIVWRTGRSARIDSSGEDPGEPGGAVRATGIRSTVGTPVIVEGHLWGVIAAGTITRPALPPDTERRLASFTDLLSVAIANTESRADLARLAEQQAALRRVATVVAADATLEEVFAAVTEEVGQLLAIEITSMGRFGSDGTVTFPAIWTSAGSFLPPDNRWALEGKNIPTLVAETGRPARMDSLEDASGPIGTSSRERGYRSQIGTPIFVDGRLWGLMMATSTAEQPLAPDTEARLASFTELLAMAIANTESRATQAQLADEQAALRRVATLVARGAPPDEVLTAVAAEVEEVLPVEFALMGRYESDDTVSFPWALTETGERRMPARIALGGNNLATIVARTCAPARIDGNKQFSGPLGDYVRRLGVSSSVGTPIIVDGRLWGVMLAATTAEPLPAGTEARLADFTALVGTAIANAESRAALIASRARIVAAADQSRRRIERDLHDGAQQRLVHAVILLKLALRALDKSEPGNAGELVAEALQHAEQANSELRDLAHGILPAALTHGGLRVGVQALVSRLSLPVSVDVSVGRLPPGIEASAYFVISEALTNVVKHADADGAAVTARAERGELRVEIRDDGVGGARCGESTGLGGLRDRVSALHGRLVIDSPPGRGTHVSAFLPIPSAADGAPRAR